MLKNIKQLTHGPQLYDPYIYQNLLKAHLNPEQESATRKLDFVHQSLDWISSVLPVTQHKRLLDLDCVTGIYAELFHTKGYQVTGLDISKTLTGMLKHPHKINVSAFNT